ncbi:hypothetical protein [Sporolactobacillus laevolacticus]|uniref:hypothetical protein n=1 Tax=Sporolactobacillus laevolacticus TaxID=33018 RepID=UPI0025B58486|nr:hypothetical protein [Sporolactobacillus laevolacticus]MDN3956220.1 hypothetical protein [Sporolactobacillus laevolacticus]
MPTANTAINPSEKLTRLFVEAKISGFATVPTSNPETAIIDVTALNDVEVSLINTLNQKFDMEIADWDIDVTGIENGFGEMEENTILIKEDPNQSASIAEDLLKALKQEQDKLYEAAEQSNAYFHQAALSSFEKCLSILGVSIPYPTKEGESK